MAKQKFLILVGIVFGALFVTIPVATVISDYNSIHFTLLENAGIMIESKGFRIYVDPILLPDEYVKPADVVCVTHPHADHYLPFEVNKLQKETTINIFPANMSDAVIMFDGVGVNPGNVVDVSERVTITAFYMYTFSPEGYEASHPRENNWTSYIIEIDGMTFFHAGDSKNIPEYVQLTGLIDVVCLPLGPGCQSMAETEVADACNTIQPQYMIPLHFQEPNNDIFFSIYGVLFEATYINLNHFESYRF
jgi:L-ascorbate metabolism protein UlaG (beta-lactamase superfamily)